MTAMTKRGIRLVLFAWAITARADWIDFTVNTAIPDNDPAGLQDTQTLSGFLSTIDFVEVRLSFSAAPSDYAFNGDYYVTLQHDSGFAVLLNRVGRTSTDALGYDDNGFNIAFTLTGDDVHLYRDLTPSYDVNGALIGMWGVDGRNVDPDLVLDTSPRTSTLASFNGLDPNGNWTVFVADMNQNGNATFVSWGVNVTVVPEPSVMVLLTLGMLLVLPLAIRRRRESLGQVCRSGALVRDPHHDR